MIDSAELVELQIKIEKLEMSNVRLIAELGRIAQTLGVEPSMKMVLGKIEELRANKARLAWSVDYNLFESEAEADKYNTLMATGKDVEAVLIYDNRRVNTLDQICLNKLTVTVHKSGEELAKERTLRSLSWGQKELLGITE